MLRKLLLIFILITAFGCTQEKKEEDKIPEGPTTPTEEVALILDIGPLDGVNKLLLTNAPYDFGATTQELKKIQKIIKIKNSSTMPINMNVVPMAHNMGFSIIKNSLCGLTLHPSGECSLTIQFNNQNLFDATYRDGLIINVGSSSLAVQFSATVEGNPYNGPIAGMDKINASLDAPFNLKVTNYRTMTISNSGSVRSMNFDYQMPAGYSVRISRCSTLLIPAQVCSMQVVYDSGLDDPPPGSAMLSSSTTATSIDLLTGTMSYETNDTLLSSILGFPLLINEQNGYTMIHYQKPVNYIRRTDYKLFLTGE